MPTPAMTDATHLRLLGPAARSSRTPPRPHLLTAAGRCDAGAVMRLAHDLARDDVADAARRTLAGLTDDAWEVFSHPGRGADLSDGKWTKADAAYKAKLTLRRIETGKVDLGSTEGRGEIEGYREVAQYGRPVRPEAGRRQS